MQDRWKSFSLLIEARNTLGRYFAACLGSIALVVNIIAGVIQAELVESILIRSVSSMVLFACFGWIFGQSAEAMVRQSLEANFRRKALKAVENKEVKQ